MKQVRCCAAVPSTTLGTTLPPRTVTTPIGASGTIPVVFGLFWLAYPAPLDSDSLISELWCVRRRKEPHPPNFTRAGFWLEGFAGVAQRGNLTPKSPLLTAARTMLVREKRCSAAWRGDFRRRNHHFRPSESPSPATRFPDNLGFPSAEGRAGEGFGVRFLLCRCPTQTSSVKKQAGDEGDEVVECSAQRHLIPPPLLLPRRSTVGKGGCGGVRVAGEGESGGLTLPTHPKRHLIRR
jgi:hypothetical protein